MRPHAPRRVTTLPGVVPEESALVLARLSPLLSPRVEEILHDWAPVFAGWGLAFISRRPHGVP
jgi:hypothetical protein